MSGFADQADLVLKELRAAGEVGIPKDSLQLLLEGKCIVGPRGTSAAHQVLLTLEATGMARHNGDRWYAT